MEKIIKKKLEEIEKAENVKIILAVESGSRAWGFESKDSDYDVRFIYIRKTEDYLKLEGNRDVIEWQLDDLLDINGWDIQKALRLLYKSNPVLFEWCHSPIVYKETSETEALKKLAADYFSPKKSLFHYWHMAQGNYREHLTGEKVKGKKYFYVLRPILASKWIKEYQTVPPVEFSRLVEQVLTEPLKPVVNDLMVKKQSSNELDLVDKIVPLNEYIEQELIEMKQLAETTFAAKDKRWTELNQFFLALL
jgi:predicted nucleotidyltransferase